MKTTVKVNVMSPEDIVEGLELRRMHPALPRAESDLEAAREALARAREAAQDAVREVEAIRDQHAAGEASAADLEAAIGKRNRAALAIGPARAAVRDAEQAVEEEHRAARDVVHQEAKARVALLQEQADQLRPILDAIDTAEETLIRHIDKVCAWHQRVGETMIPRRAPALPEVELGIER